MENNIIYLCRCEETVAIITLNQPAQISYNAYIKMQWILQKHNLNKFITYWNTSMKW